MLVHFQLYLEKVSSMTNKRSIVHWDSIMEMHSERGDVHRTVICE